MADLGLGLPQDVELLLAVKRTCPGGGCQYGTVRYNPFECHRGVDFRTVGAQIWDCPPSEIEVTHIGAMFPIAHPAAQDVADVVANLASDRTNVTRDARAVTPDRPRRV